MKKGILLIMIAALLTGCAADTKPTDQSAPVTQSAPTEETGERPAPTQQSPDITQSAPPEETSERPEPTQQSPDITQSAPPEETGERPEPTQQSPEATQAAPPEETTEQTAEEDYAIPTPEEGVPIYDSLFVGFDENPSVGMPMDYGELAGIVRASEIHYGSTADFLLLRTVRVLSPSEANKYRGELSDKSVYEAVVEKSLISGEEKDETIILLGPTGTVRYQKKGDPIYAPDERFTCAVVWDEEKGCYRSVGVVYRFDVIEQDGALFAYSRNNYEIDEVLSEGEDVAVAMITSTTQNPAVYTKKIPLDALAEFVRNDWAERGIGRESDKE